MSRIAELWSPLTPEEQDRAANAMRAALGDRGVAIIVAVAQEARLYTSGSIALDRAQAAITGDSYPAPPEPGPYCHDCGQPATEPLRWNDPVEGWVLLDPGCYESRLLHRCCDLHNRHCEPPADLCCRDCAEVFHPMHPRGSICVLGDQLQALPAPMPIQEEP